MITGTGQESRTMDEGKLSVLQLTKAFLGKASLLIDVPMAVSPPIAQNSHLHSFLKITYIDLDGASI